MSAQDCDSEIRKIIPCGKANRQMKKEKGRFEEKSCIYCKKWSINAAEYFAEKKKVLNFAAQNTQSN